MYFDGLSLKITLEGYHLGIDTFFITGGAIGGQLCIFQFPAVTTDGNSDDHRWSYR